MTAWLPTLLQNVRRGGLRVLVFKKTKISIRGSLEIDEKSILYLNMPNFFASSENG